jgi:hypothetical protein
MKIASMILAAVVLAAGFSACSSKQQAPQPPMVDMGSRSYK